MRCQARFLGSGQVVLSCRSLTWAVLLFMAVVLLYSRDALASSIVLKSGAHIDAKISERGSDYIKVDFNGVVIQYYFDEIELIDGKALPLGLDLPVQEMASGGAAATESEKEVEVPKPQGEAQDYVDDYVESVSRFVAAAKKEGPSAALPASEMSLLEEFAKDHPASKFVKDIQYFDAVVHFVNAHHQFNAEEAWQSIRAVEKLVAAYPQDGVDTYLRGRLVKIMGGDVGYLDISLLSALMYMRGTWGVRFGNPQLARDNLYKLKDATDLLQSGNKELIKSVYYQLLVACEALDDQARFKEVLAASRLYGVEFIPSKKRPAAEKK